MARTRRAKSMAEGTAHYHLVARACNRQFLFGDVKTKNVLAELIMKAAAFSGVKVAAYAVMDNHIHVLCTVVRTGGKLPADEIVRRVRILKGDAAADALAQHWDELAAAGFDGLLEDEADRFRSRMDDISAFMKTLKELFAIWYNREFRYSGSVWSGVFKSTMVERGDYFERCRRYIVYNPIRAGIVVRAKDYRWVWCVQEAETEVFPGCLPVDAFMRRMAQLSAGKIYGSEAFVLKWIVGLGDRFHAAHVTAHAVGEIGFSSHGWRLAKKGAAAA